MFGDGAKGFARQTNRNEEFGVQLEATRKKRGAAWEELWTSDYLPGQEFKTYHELQAALTTLDNPLKPLVLILNSEPKGEGSGRCWLCHGEWSVTVRVKTGWRDSDVKRVPSCVNCLDKIKADPLATIEARHKEVRETDIKRRLESPL